jgi:hypothetical protein
MEVMVDGEIHGQTPVTVTAISSALNVRVPGVKAPGLHVEKDSIGSSAKLPTSSKQV